MDYFHRAVYCVIINLVAADNYSPLHLFGILQLGSWDGECPTALSCMPTIVVGEPIVEFLQGSRTLPGDCQSVVKAPYPFLGSVVYGKRIVGIHYTRAWWCC